MSEYVKKSISKTLYKVRILTSTATHVLAHAESPRSDIPQPLPITEVNPKFTEVPSSEIDKTKVKTIANVLRKYPALRMECKMSILLGPASKDR